MLLKLSKHCDYRPLPEGAAVFNKLTNATQLMNEPYATAIAKLAQARLSDSPVKKSDIYTWIEPKQADEFIEQALDLGIIELSIATPAQ